MGFGDYPAEYNPKVHGPYDPARFYGKREFPFRKDIVSHRAEPCDGIM